MKFVLAVAVLAPTAPNGPTTIDVVNPKDPEEKPVRFRIVGRHDRMSEAKEHLNGTEFDALAIIVRGDGRIFAEKPAPTKAAAAPVVAPAPKPETKPADDGSTTFVTPPTP
jgi:hypothetical protein